MLNNVCFRGKADIAAKVLTRDEARIAANVAKLPELLSKLELFRVLSQVLSTGRCRRTAMHTVKASLLAVAILCFAAEHADAAEIHDGDTGYVSNNSIWFTNESDLSVWKRIRQAFAPKDVKTYQQIILEERQAWQFVSGPIKVKVLSYWANQHELNVKMLTEGRLADSEWWVEDKDYSNSK